MCLILVEEEGRNKQVVDYSNSLLPHHPTYYSLLSEDNLSSSTLEMVSASFSRNFTREDHFRVGCTLVCILGCNHFLFVHQHYHLCLADDAPPGGRPSSPLLPEGGSHLSSLPALPL